MFSCFMTNSHSMSKLNSVPQQGIMPQSPFMPQPTPPVNGSRNSAPLPTESTLIIANHSTRFGAFLLEGIAPLLIMLVFGLVFGSLTYLSPNNPSWLVFTFVGPIILIIVLNIYLMATRSQTIGKYLTNIQVVNILTNKRESFWRFVLLRQFVGRILPNLVFLQLYFFVDSLFVFSEKNRTLHDRIGGTIVVDLPPEQQRKSLFDFTALPS
jgi:uncharacterized RDD family membrane protein YckC